MSAPCLLSLMSFFVAMRIQGLDFRSSFNSSFLSISSNPESLKRSMMSAFAIVLYDFSIPRFSIGSSLLLIPAVSLNRKRIESISFSPSTTSLVVPAIGETMALSSFSMALRSEDFPTFGSPAIATVIPWYCLLERFVFSIVESRLWISLFRFFLIVSSSSS